jgi:8-oxo-dGTP pyrophosphatase MutT (NUDIX family)
MIEPQAAATVMIGRDSRAGIEFFMLRRSSRSVFMPDVYVFPGGRVEAQDRSLAARRQADSTPLSPDPAYTYAAARETFEESGLLFAADPVDERALAAARRRILAGTHTFAELLDELDTHVDTDALRYFSHWVTPPFETRRFDTHFFVARAPVGQAALADASETYDGRWIVAAEALAGHANGTFALIYPTIKHLERLAAFPTLDLLLDYTARKSIHTVMPSIEPDRTFAIPPALEGVW